jgi:hypothetical protein
MCRASLVLRLRTHKLCVKAGLLIVFIYYGSGSSIFQKVLDPDLGVQNATFPTKI